MPPAWLQTLAAIHVPLAILIAVLVVVDIYLLGRRQHMAIMEAVWPLTMLYWGPFGLILYVWFGRAMPTRGGGDHRHPDRPMWQATFDAAAHCGAGCALGDFVGDWLAFAAGFSLLGSEMTGRFFAAFAFAYLFGIAFQYFSVAPMRGLGVREGLAAAIKIDTASLLAYQIGMFGFMAFRSWVYPDLRPTEWTYWLMMQVAMVAGFATTYPLNWWLIRRGIKEKM